MIVEYSDNGTLKTAYNVRKLKHSDPEYITLVTNNGHVATFKKANTQIERVLQE